MPGALRGVELSVLRGLFALMLFSTEFRYKLGAVDERFINGARCCDCRFFRNLNHLSVCHLTTKDERFSGYGEDGVEIFVRSWVSHNMLNASRSSWVQEYTNDPARSKTAWALNFCFSLS